MTIPAPTEGRELTWERLVRTVGEQLAQVTIVAANRAFGCCDDEADC